ncbi:hypothetical protein MG293_017288 [Ovis ammon polii]|uniref:Uncharacterized protein n=1 Tax=Ovis ammon polii TaxID=230172 RepID=A0AAD4TWG1_OVIAM|nr:hypothetical protein MG293_017288 [Ovis ammon polii]
MDYSLLLLFYKLRCRRLMILVGALGMNDIGNHSFEFAELSEQLKMPLASWPLLPGPASCSQLALRLRWLPADVRFVGLREKITQDTFQHRDPIWQMMSKQNLSATIKPKPQFVKLHAALENAEVGAVFRKYKCRKEQRNTCENIPRIIFQWSKEDVMEDCHMHLKNGFHQGDVLLVADSASASPRDSLSQHCRYLFIVDDEQM